MKKKNVKRFGITLTGINNCNPRVKPRFSVPGVAADVQADGGTVFGWGGIKIYAHGRTDSIQELVRNSGNYLVRVRFTNLHYTGVLFDTQADVLSVEIIKVR